MGRNEMDILIDNACGLDVHKNMVVACIMGVETKKRNTHIPHYDKRFTRDEQMAKK
jgi:hypothetical protein